VNIFVLDRDPREAAVALCDKHVVKMILESYQMLGSAVRRYGASDEQMPLTQKGTPLRGGYHYHLCTIWAGESRNNFLWLLDHAFSLCDEYTFRYRKVHFCEAGIEKLSYLDTLIPEGRMTGFAQAMPDQYKSLDTVKAYRDYYWFDKRVNIEVKWDKGRNPPHWWIQRIKKSKAGVLV
jgi:hypothetical protein